MQDKTNKTFFYYLMLTQCARKLNVPLRIFSVNVTKPAVSANLVTFTEDILNGNFNFV